MTLEFITDQLFERRMRALENAARLSFPKEVPAELKARLDECRVLREQMRQLMERQR